MSFSFANAVLMEEPVKPVTLEVSGLATTLAEHLNMNPHEVQYLIRVAHSDADNMIVSSHWGKLLAVIKLREAGGLQDHMQAVKAAQRKYEDELAAWNDRVRWVREDMRKDIERGEREWEQKWKKTRKAYNRFMERLEGEGRSLRSFTGAEEALLKELQRLYKDMKFKKGIGFVKGRYVQLKSPIPELKMDCSWYHLARALVED